MNRLFSLYQYIRYRLRAKNLHGIHSPFVYEFTEQVLYSSAHYYAYDTIETFRIRVNQSKQKVNCPELGGGSVSGKKTTRKVTEVLKNSAKPVKYAQLLFRICNYFNVRSSLEIGTSLGFSSAYIAMANSENKLATLEGCQDLAAYAMSHFSLLELRNVRLHIGNFDTLLPQVLTDISQLDLVFFDGNHRYAPTINYFEQCKTKAHNNSVFIIDDIYWSTEMTQAWEKIKQDSDVYITIDLFYMGLVFFRKQQAKQHFVVKF